MTPVPLDKKIFARTALAGCALAPLLAANAPALPSGLNGTRPNVLFILIDDLGATDLQCLGSDFYETPNLDKLRAQGMLFTNAYAAAPVCAPARAAILTGRYPVRTGITDVFMPKKAVRMTRLVERVTGRNFAPEEVTLGDLMKKAGYATACIGKWHVGDSPGSLPQDKGFDLVVKTPRKDDAGDYKQIRKFTQAAIDFIDANKDQKPFFVYLSHNAVHLPFTAPPDLIEKYEKKLKPGMKHNYPIYAATIEYLDRETGRLMAELERMGVAKNTIVVFTSDNGGRASNWEYQLVTTNLPYHGGKHNVYEGGLRVPTLMYWPGRISPNSTCKTPFSQVDYFTTFAALAGQDVSKNPILDGVSITPLLEGRKLPPRALYWFYPHYNIAALYGKSSIYEYARPVAAVLKDGWKLVEWFEDPLQVELFKVDEDPCEYTNMAAHRPQKVQELRALLEAWYPSVGAKLLEQRKDFDPNEENSVLWRWGEARYESVTDEYAPPEMKDYKPVRTPKK